MMEVKRLPQKPAKGQRFTNEVGIVFEWEPAGMGDPWPGVWIVVHLPERYR